jgi:hypothetical protein
MNDVRQAYRLLKLCATGTLALMLGVIPVAGE